MRDLLMLGGLQRGILCCSAERFSEMCLSVVSAWDKRRLAHVPGDLPKLIYEANFSKRGRSNNSSQFEVHKP